jgi:hypothetical protein
MQPLHWPSQLNAMSACSTPVDCSTSDVGELPLLLLSLHQVQVHGYKGNYHYQRLATHMGAQYQLVVSVSSFVRRLKFVM